MLYLRVSSYNINLAYSIDVAFSSMSQVFVASLLDREREFLK